MVSNRAQVTHVGQTEGTKLIFSHIKFSQGLGACYLKILGLLICHICSYLMSLIE